MFAARGQNDNQGRFSSETNKTFCPSVRRWRGRTDTGGIRHDLGRPLILLPSQTFALRKSAAAAAAGRHQRQPRHGVAVLALPGGIEPVVKKGNAWLELGSLHTKLGRREPDAKITMTLAAAVFVVGSMAIAISPIARRVERAQRQGAERDDHPRPLRRNPRHRMYTEERFPLLAKRRPLQNKMYC